MQYPSGVETLIFVDIDGVLNVGIRDQGQAPLLLSEQNCKCAVDRRGGAGCSAYDKECVERVLSVIQHQVEPCEGADTFRSLACGRCDCSRVLLERLAAILTAAGKNRSVVLASNWRKPKYTKKVQALEGEISRLMGCRFAFDARTRLAEEKMAGDRLRCIGDFVQQHVSGRGSGKPRPLRILVLDDFFVNPMDGTWECGGNRMHSVGDAEKYIRSRATSAVEMVVKVIHTYQEWSSQSGLRVQVGAGLSDGHRREAVAFLTSQEFQQQRPTTSARVLCTNGAVHLEDAALDSLDAFTASKKNGIWNFFDFAEVSAVLGICFSGFAAVSWPCLCMHL
mmetsp:Transcript_53420/g.135512  ORF Transcript_53420/g.135512 Transcript_53420/m.135512 type:complete len:337 (-) Transcript_53420:164-1174(-)